MIEHEHRSSSGNAAKAFGRERNPHRPKRPAADPPKGGPTLLETRQDQDGERSDEERRGQHDPPPAGVENVTRQPRRASDLRSDPRHRQADELAATPGAAPARRGRRARASASPRAPPLRKDGPHRTNQAASASSDNNILPTMPPRPPHGRPAASQPVRANHHHHHGAGGLSWHSFGINRRFRDRRRCRGARISPQSCCSGCSRLAAFRLCLRNSSTIRLA